MSDQPFIPFHRPSIGKEEFDAVNRVLASQWLTTGPETHQFEREFAEYIGCKHALAVNSATAGLQLAFDAIGLRPGDKVLVPTYTFTSTAEVVTYFGARPVLCDSVPGGFNLDPADVRCRITENTRAIIPVHIAGEACDLESIHRMSESHDLRVIEDAAHAFPTNYRGQRVGTISDLTVFSFYATKTITTGEGGMVTTESDAFAQRISMMRLHGIVGDAWKRYSKEGSWYYEVEEAGFKQNMPDLLAALGRAQLQKCDDFAQKRRAIATYYNQRFAGIEELELPPTGEISGHSWHLYILRIKPELLEVGRQEFISQLKQAGVGTSVHFIPLHLHPFYARQYGYKPGDFPNAEAAYNRAISLPIYPDLEPEQMRRVANAVEQIVFANRRRVTSVVA